MELFDYRSFHTTTKFPDNRDVIVCVYQAHADEHIDSLKLPWTRRTWAGDHQTKACLSTIPKLHHVYPIAYGATTSPFFFACLPALKRPMCHAVKVSKVTGDSQTENFSVV
ncbi:uncharacterized protein EV420DRAFT_1642478 [Desarmillaria tabescens]|uniref:Uncharacterized protein n=1 Tax=Armillaria tabescens TaxID=1929756 RepID=A0AA39KF57_ARMTA|nr:uncharacterized protein EV420DRAFT_1642478 [Desarmillaria tabescens]KAK0458756.1 hypothetical protein EV420DRAFT_1642478 [Desarmillaria tabescens]